MQRSIVPPPPLLAKDFRYKSKIFQYPCNISPILIHPTLQKPSRKCLRYFMTYAKTHRPSIPPLLKPFDICLEYFLIRPVLQKLSKKCLKYFMILAKVLCTSDICLQFFTTHAKSYRPSPASPLQRPSFIYLEHFMTHAKSLQPPTYILNVLSLRTWPGDKRLTTYLLN